MNIKKANPILTVSIAAILLTAAVITVFAGCASEPDPSDTTASTGENTEANTTGQTTQATVQPTESETTPLPITAPTEATTVPTEATTVPTETPPAPTETEPDTDPIGIGLYTREQLESLSSVKRGYGPGRTSGGARAPYAVDDQAAYGKYGASFIGEDTHKIYLTFDCGYEYTATDANGNSYRVTEKILDVLKEKNVKAVFFVTMYYCKSNPDLVQRMIDEGHTVGNHTNNHPVMSDISIDEMMDEVMSLHEYVLDHFGYEMKLFRPPTGAYSAQSLAVVQNLGYKNVFWSFAYADYDTDAQPELDDAYRLITSSHHNGAIYLLHAISATNASVLGDVIDFFLAEGYSLELFA